MVRGVAVHGGREQEGGATVRVDALAGAARDLLDQAHVGVDRQVMAVILEGGRRDHDDDVVAGGELWRAPARCAARSGDAAWRHARSGGGWRSTFGEIASPDGSASAVSEARAGRLRLVRLAAVRHLGAEPTFALAHRPRHLRLPGVGGLPDVRRSRGTSRPRSDRALRRAADRRPLRHALARARATWVEAAAVGRREASGTSPSSIVARPAGVDGLGATGEQRLRVRVLRPLEHMRSALPISITRPRYMTATRSQQRPGEPDVVRDEDQARPRARRSASSRWSTCARHRDVERRDGLVADEPRGLRRERAGDRDALPLTARELVRIAVARSAPPVRGRRPRARSRRAGRARRRAPCLDAQRLLHELAHASCAG